MKRFGCAFLCALLALVVLSQARATTYNVVTQYGADNTGVNDATTAIQNAINAAASGTGNTVYLPAGTYLVGAGGLSIQNTNGLTFEGAGQSSTMLWVTRAQAHGFSVWGNTNFTMEGFSEDVQKLPSTGLYDLGLTQGTITSINVAANQVTIAREAGYPLLNRSDFATAATGNDGYSKAFWLLADPTREDFTSSPTITAITPSQDGTTAVVTIGNIPGNTYVGEKWCIYTTSGPIWLDMGYGDSGTTNIQNINFYGGAVSWMGDADNQTGTLNFNNVYCGPPSYQTDRALTCCQGWAMSNNNRAAINITNSTFLRTWDDVFDIGCNSDVGISQTPAQQAANQIVVNNDNYQAGDSVELIDNTDAPTGTIYESTTIKTVGSSGGNTLLTLNGSAFTLRNPNVDTFTDLTDAGPITATNDMFNNATGRHVYFRSGKSVTVTGCTFINSTPLIIGGLGVGSEGPGEARNVTVTGNTFQNSQGVLVDTNFGQTTAITSSNVNISNNKFLSDGRDFDQDSQPVQVNETAGVTIANNWFDNNWGANVQAFDDSSVNVTGNTFLHPNEILGPATADTSVIYLSNVTTGSLSGNLIYSAGPYTYFLNKAGPNVSGVNGLSDGTTIIDNPLAFYLSYDQMVMDSGGNGVGGNITQWGWLANANQYWTALPNYATPGYFTINNSHNGDYVGNATSKTAGNDIYLENQSWTSGTPTPEQLWNFGYIDSNNNNIVNNYSGYVINVIGGSSSPGQDLCQWYSGNASNSNFYVVQPPTATATQQYGTVTISWTPVPYATSYSIGRSTTSGGPYTTIVSGLTAGPYTDAAVTGGTIYYYVVTAAGLPISNGQSNQTWAVPNGTYTPVNLATAYNITGIEPNGWTYLGLGFDNYEYTYSSTLTGSSVTWSGDLFGLGSPAKPNTVGDAGQRIILPDGLYSNLLILGAYLGTSPTSTGTFQPTITYGDGSSTTLSQGMTNWCGTASQTGESNAATYSYRLADNGAQNATTCYIHAYSIPINSAKPTSWLTLPNTGNFRIMAMDMGGANLSAIAPGQNLLPGQYIVSPNGQYILTQQSDGNLVLYHGSSPQNEGASVWASGTYGNNPAYTTMQTDGNLVIYAGTPTNKGSALWGSGTYGNIVTALQLTNTPEVQIVNGSTVIWQKP